MLQERETEVSVIIPTKNRSEFLRRAMGSVATQNFSSIEVCIVDNNTDSYQNTLVHQLVEEFTFNYTNIKWIYLKSNTTFASGARNAGIRATSGKYICFLDDDDELLNNSIKRRVEVMENDPDLALVYCGGYTKIYSYPFKMYRFHAYNVLEKRLNMMLCAMLIRRSVIEKYQFYFDERLRRTEDYDLGKRLLMSNLKIVSFPDPLIMVNLHADPRMSTTSLDNYDFKEILLDKWGEDAKVEMCNYAPGVIIWRKAFGIEKKSYVEVSKILKENGYEITKSFKLKFHIASISPMLFFFTYHIFSSAYQSYKNKKQI